MGYTHSWYRNKEIEPLVMDMIRSDFSKLQEVLPAAAQIIDTPDFWGAPDDIAFGGISCTCEPMVFCRISQARQITAERAQEEWMIGKHFEYCKTGKLPYDLTVKALLIIVKSHLKGSIRIITDGTNDDWMEAFKLFCQAFGYSKKLFINDHELYM